MLVIPVAIIAIGGIGGAGGLGLAIKGLLDTTDASETNRKAYFKNEKNIMRFHAVSDKLEEALEELGKQRMVISKNFSVFSSAFEKIRNRPSFSQMEDAEFPKFEFDEIKSIAAVASTFLGAGVGVVGGALLAAAASSGTTAAVMAWGVASTGKKIAELSGAAATKAALAALGGGAVSAGGGGIALGTLVLNIASLGVGVLFEGIALAIAGSIGKKHADKAFRQTLENEKIINEAINKQFAIIQSVEEIRKVSIDICNNVYKPLVMKMKELVDKKQDYNLFTKDEMLLVENTILAVQILHHLNNIPLYKVTKMNEEGEVEEVESNVDEVAEAVRKAKEKSKDMRRD